MEKQGSFGWAVTGMGDLNGNGVTDAAVGAPGEAAGGRPYSGRVYLVDGKDGQVLETVFSPEASAKGFFGAVLAPLGDIDGDGIEDLGVGAHRESVEGTEAAGRVYLVSGTDGTVIETLTSPRMQAEGLFGSSVSGIHDVNSDGTPDIIVGASDETAQERPQAGRVYLFSGTDGAVLDSLSSPNPEAKGAFGSSVASVGGASGQADPSVIVGAPQESAGANRRSGRAYLFNGVDGSLRETLNSPNAQPVGTFGTSVAGLGDFDGEGGPDVVVGAHHESVDENRRAGRAYLFNGKNGQVLETLRSPTVMTEGLFGKSVASLPDVNEDGVPDLVVGAHGETASNKFGAGHTYVLSGADGSLLETLVSPNAEEEGGFGAAVAGVRPSQESRSARILVGAFWETVEKKQEGRAYFFAREP